MTVMFQLHCFAGSIFFLGLCTASVLAFVLFTITELSSKPFSRKHTFTWLLFDDISSYAQSSSTIYNFRAPNTEIYFVLFDVQGCWTGRSRPSSLLVLWQMADVSHSLRMKNDKAPGDMRSAGREASIQST